MATTVTVRERFNKVMNFENPGDRIPMIEWAAWWDKTINRFKSEGMPPDLNWEESQTFFGLDVLYLITAAGLRGRPAPPHHGGAVVTDMESYERIRPLIMRGETIEHMKASARALQQRHERGEIVIRLWLDGFFWFPRGLLGIEPHLYAFYDNPELMHKINSDLVEFNLRAVEELFTILEPDMIGFAEDMSYNHGPMLSYELYKEFIMPYYKKIVPYIKKPNTKILTDSDGNIAAMIPWLIESGIEGVYPLERQAGTDIARIRQEYPTFLMMGGYDKMVMSRDENAMRNEFERILPVMKSGGYIPSVDHQTPPEVSLENYKIYIRLFKEYCEKAAKCPL